MIKKVVATVLSLALLGAGCLNGQQEPEVPPYVPGEIPTEEQLGIMTDEEKIEGMGVMVEEHPPEEITKEEQVQEIGLSIEHMKEGTTIRHGEFEGRFLHPAAGSVRVIEEEGKYVIVFSEEFSVLLGPAL